MSALKAQDLAPMLRDLAKYTKNQPTADDVQALTATILRHGLTREEILRGHNSIADQAQPWWPKPGEFLAHARPPTSTAVVLSEANLLFDLICDNPGHAYGRYSPEVGTLRERRLIESAHGQAAGAAFVAAGGPVEFSRMTEKSETFIRKKFVEAYESARADHGAPLTLDPARLLPAPAAAPLLSGSVEEGPNRRRFQELVRGGFREPSPKPRVDVAARVAELRKQAEDIGGVA